MKRREGSHKSDVPKNHVCICVTGESVQRSHNNESMMATLSFNSSFLYHKNCLEIIGLPVFTFICYCVNEIQATEFL